MDLPNIEIVAAAAHDGWMRAKRAAGITTRLSEWGEEFMVPYAQMSERAKDIDRAAVRSVYDAIEAARPSQYLTFSEALEALRSHRRVGRRGWNGRGMWLALVPGDQWGLGSGQPYDAGHACSQLRPWVGICAADGSFLPWTVSQADLLAVDWEILNDPAAPLPWDGSGQTELRA